MTFKSKVNVKYYFKSFKARDARTPVIDRWRMFMTYLAKCLLMVCRWQRRTRIADLTLESKVKVKYI